MVPLVEDDDVEGVESFEVVIANPVNAEIARDVALGQIRDSSPHKVYINTRLSVPEDAGEVEVRVELRSRRPRTQKESVAIATQAITAIGGSDYSGMYKVLEFEPSHGTETIIVRIPILNDTVVEAVESFRVRIFNPSAGLQLSEFPAREKKTLDDDG